MGNIPPGLSTRNFSPDLSSIYTIPIFNDYCLEHSGVRTNLHKKNIHVEKNYIRTINPYKDVERDIDIKSSFRCSCLVCVYFGILMPVELQFCNKISWAIGDFFDQVTTLKMVNDISRNLEFSQFTYQNDAWPPILITPWGGVDTVPFVNFIVMEI